jgi:MoxR-like ATPase
VGPAGSGKTTLSGQLAQCLKRGFGFLSLSGGTTEGQLLGRLTSDGRYLPSLFVELYEKGGVFLLDEVDAADPNVLLVLNSALANGDLSVPARVKKPFAKRHENFVLVCAANTWGTGADWQYVGRNQLDAAFLSRFAGAIIEVGYDEALERVLTMESWYVAFVRVRQAAVQAKLRRVLGTREMLAGQKLLKAGYTDQETWAALTAGWTPDEISKARIAA